MLLATSPRTPPGCLSWPAWEALRSGAVLTLDAASPQLPFLTAAGVDVTCVQPPEGSAAERSLAASLVERAGGGEQVVWLSAGDADAGVVRALADLAVRAPALEVEVVYGSWDLPGARLLDVVQVMDRLRSPGGCPWDAEQTHASLAPYLLEEAYEAYQALEDGDLVGLREEMGDVLLQVAFHARLAEELPEGQRWSIDDVAGELVDKLVGRHPHVFADVSVEDAAEVERNWQALKDAEKGRTSVTDGVPLALPALLLAAKLQKRAARLGAPLPAYDGLGGELWDLVRRCREAGVDAETELRTVAREFRDRLAEAERQVRAEGRDPAALTPTEWEQRWS